MYRFLPHRSYLCLLALAALISVSVLRTFLDQSTEAAGLDQSRPALLDCTGNNGVSPKLVRQKQEAWARYLGCKVEETVEVGKGVRMVFVLVPPGKFKMGSPESEKGRDKDETLHTVTLTKPFYLGKYEVTQAQYEALTGKNPSQCLKGADLPVEFVSWEEAQDYAAKLTLKRGGKWVYRLPSEAEWEYACRGGRPSSHPFGVGDGLSLSSNEANFYGIYPYGRAAKGPELHKTCPVGSYQANVLGLYDMHGNVWEWCTDRYGSYPEHDVTNPAGPAVNRGRVYRGGSWNIAAEKCRAAMREGSEPDLPQWHIGFRLARSIRPARK